MAADPTAGVSVPEEEKDPLARVLASNSQQEQIDALEALVKDIQAWDIARDSDKMESLAVNLLQQVVVVGTAAQAALYACLLQSPTAAMAAAVQTLQKISTATIQSPTALQASLHVLRGILLVRPQTRAPVWVVEQQQHPNALLTQQRVNLFLVIPALVANACHAMRCNLPTWAVPSNFRVRLVECAVSMIVLAAADGDDQAKESNKATNNEYFQLLVQKLIRHGGAREVATALYRQFERLSVDVDADGQLLLADVILETHQKRLSPRESALVCRAILQQTVSLVQEPTRYHHKAVPWTNAWLDLACLPILQTCRKVRDAVVRLIVLSPSSVLPEAPSDQLLCHCVASLLACVHGDVSSNKEAFDDSSDSDDEAPLVVSTRDRVLRKHLTEVVATWSQTVFVRQTDRRVQRHVTSFLLSGMILLSEKKEDLSADLAAAVVEGVTVRLHSNIDSIRKDGMQMGECLAKRLDQDLQFDELETQRQDEAAVMEPQGRPEPLRLSNKTANRPSTTSRRNRRARTHRQMDPDAEYISEEGKSDSGGSFSSEFDDDSVWDDENVAAYDLDDDEEDLRETARPLYLYQCTEFLRTPESEDHAQSRHETALKELPALVRAHPIDLKDHSESLAIELLRMENKFNMEEFTEMVLSSLVALVVEDPISICQTLVAQLFQECSLSNRLTALTSLSEAALELSGEQQLEVWKQERNEAASVGGPRVSGKRHLVEVAKVVGNTSIASYTERALETNESSTRRWGHRQRRRATEHMITNRFGQVAPVWFYTLLSSFMERKEDQILWQGSIGSSLLARIFVTLASFVEASGNCPGTDVLAKDLFQLVWSFRNADVAEVRISVLCAVAASFKVIREDLLLEMLFSGTIQDLPQTLQTIAFDDSDESCRSLAKMIAGHVATAIQSVSQDRTARKTSVLDF